AAVPPIYDWVSRFREGRAIVRAGRLYGVVDTTGRVIAPAEYDAVEVFAHDLLRVVRDGKSGLIGLDGHVVAEPRYGAITSMPPNRLGLAEPASTAAPVSPDASPDARNRFIPGTFRSSMSFDDLRFRGKAALVHRDGSVIRDFAHIEVRPFDDTRGLAWAR